MTGLKPYPAYKQSGTEWLGAVPADWAVEPLGKLFVERRQTVSDSDYPPLSVTREGVVPQLENVAKTSDGDGRKLVRAGDFAINSRSDRKGSSGLADRDGSVSVITTVITPRNLDPRFTHHLLRSAPFQEEFYRYGTGIVADLWSTRWSAMKSIRLPVPSQDEQRVIASFLDRETAEIDAFIADQEELIRLLAERRAATISHAVTKGLDRTAPMRDSGVSWLGEVPEHWHIGRVGFAFSLTLGKMVNSTLVNGDPHPYIRAGNIQNAGLDLSEVKHIAASAQEVAQLSLRKGDVVIVEGGAGYGRSDVLQEDLDGWVFQNHVIRARPIGEQEPRFLDYIVKTLRARGHFEALGTYATIPNLSADKLARIEYPYMPLEEQRSIADYLDRAVLEVDDAIADAREAIALSRERRAALISAAVTGKIDVREHEPFQKRENRSKSGTFESAS